MTPHTPQTKVRVGLLGVGVMGSAMAQRLLTRASP